MKLLLTIFLFFLLVAGCVKRGLDCCAFPQTEMIGVQTQCADPWGYGANNNESIAKLKSYLSQKNITVNKIELQSTGEGIACYGCTCSRGFTFHVWVQGQYITALTTEGFIIK